MTTSEGTTTELLRYETSSENQEITHDTMENIEDETMSGVKILKGTEDLISAPTEKSITGALCRIFGSYQSRIF
jgi:hypothetical protein